MVIVYRDFGIQQVEGIQSQLFMVKLDFSFNRMEEKTNSDYKTCISINFDALICW